MEHLDEEVVTVQTIGVSQSNYLGKYGLLNVDSYCITVVLTQTNQVIISPKPLEIALFFIKLYIYGHVRDQIDKK